VQYPAGSDVDFYSENLEMWFPGQVLSHVPIEASEVKMETVSVAVAPVEGSTDTEAKEEAGDVDPLPAPPAPTATLTIKYFIGYGINGDMLHHVEEVTLPSNKVAIAYSNSATNDRYLHPNKVKYVVIKRLSAVSLTFKLLNGSCTSRMSTYLLEW